MDRRNIITGSIYYLKLFQGYIGFKIYIVFALTLFAAFSEGFGFVMILPLLESLDGNIKEQSGIVGDTLEFINYIFGLENSVLSLLLIITFAFIIKGIVLFFALSSIAIMSANLHRNLQTKLLQNYSEMKYEYYSSRDTGHFVNVMNIQIAGVVKALNGIMNTISQVVAGIAYLIMAFIVAWKFGLMAALIGIFMLIVFTQLNNYVRTISSQFSLEKSFQTQYIVQYLQSFKYLISTAQTNKLSEKFITTVKNIANFQIKMGMAAVFTRSLREPIAVVAIMLIIFFQLVVIGDSLGPILVAIMLFYRALNAIQFVQQSWQLTLDNSGSVELVNQEFTYQDENSSPNSSKKIFPLQESVVLRNVYFKYESANNYAIKNLNFRIEANDSIALIGGSGAGKSTIADIITRSLIPEKGDVYIDGVPLRESDMRTWRQQIGYVSQNTVMFDDSIENNISMWDKTISKDERIIKIKKCSEQANIHHFISDLPEQYLTQVGDRGIRLSGGQIQRLFIARELYRDPKLLILDEATSSLDTESEEFIQESINKLKGKVTLLIIAHRLSTIRNVDYLYVLEKGEIIEEGTYDVLRNKNNSVLQKLISKQNL